MIDIFTGGLYQEHHVDLRPTSLRWKVKLLSFYIFALMSQMQVLAKVRLRIFFVQVLLQRMLSKQRGPLVHLGLSTSGNVGSIRKNYPVSNIWRQFWFCRRLNLWSVTILARYLSRGNFDFQNHYKWILPQASLSQDHQVVLSCQIYLHMIVTVNFYHHHLSQHEDHFKSRILSWSVRTVRKNYLVVVVL